MIRQMRAWLVRLLGNVRTQSGADFSEELAGHLELHTCDNILAGMTPEAARRSALLRLGGSVQTLERYRDRRGLPFVDALWQDLSYAVRSCRKNPGFTATAVLTLALGIGANTAIFSVVNAVLLRPLPFPNPERLMMVFATLIGERPHSFDVVTYPDYADLANRNHSFESMAAFAAKSMTMTVGSQAVLARGMRVTPSLFKVLGTQAAVGRVFSQDEQEPGANHVVALSESFWRQRFNASANIVGQTLRLDGTTYQIVGVMPDQFRLDQVNTEQFYIPLPIDAARGHAFLRVVGRMKEGVTQQSAQADLDTIAAELVRIYRNTNSGLGVNVVPMASALSRDVRFGLWTMLGVVTLVLLIACANVAGLTLARGAARRRELAVRAALGAGRGRLTRQLLTESLILAAAGGAAGLLMAHWTSQLLADFLAQQFRVPRIDAIRTDLVVLVFTTTVSVLTGVAFGALPALTSSAPDLQDSLREGGRSATGFRAPHLRSLLVVVETGLALVLLAGAGTLLKTFLTLKNTDPGFESSHLLVVDLWQPRSTLTSLAARTQFYDAALQQVRALRDVRAAAFVANLPMHSGFDSLSFRVLGGDRSAREAALLHSGFNIATSGYFRTMKIPILAGRDFTEADRAGSPLVVVVNEVAARQFWPGESALGRRIDVPRADKASTVFTVIGVTGSVRQFGLGDSPQPEIFLSSMQSDLDWPGLALVVSTESRPEALASSVEAALRPVSAGVPVERAVPMDAILYRSLAAPRVYTFLLGTFAAIAVVLAAIGLFGLVSYGVSQRTHEIGVRMALGATRQEIVGLVLRQGLLLAAAGAVAGIAAAAAATRLLVNLVNGVHPNDPVTMIVVTAVLLLASAFASYLPARRAARVDPMAALRSD
jgi:predicted permease